MGDNSWGCLKQTAVGCGVLLALAILFPILLGVMMTRPFNRAVDARVVIEERFGPQEAYVPPLDGAPSADRVGVFLEVRRALGSTCADLTDAEKQVGKLEKIGDQDEVRKMEVMQQAFSTTRSMMGVGSVLGNFYEARNQSLVDAEMGLGEFTYIFVVAYRDRLIEPLGEFSLFGPRITNRRVREALLSMLKNQRDALSEAGGNDDVMTPLDVEISAMEADSERIPWQDALPTAIEESLAPFREALDEAYCPAAAPLELMINVKHGPTVESK